MDVTNMILRCVAFILAWLVLGTMAFVGFAMLQISPWFGMAIPPVAALGIMVFYVNVEVWGDA